MKLHLYKIMVDDFEIGGIALPRMTQHERDVIRKQIANDRKVPVHYIRLHPVRKGAVQ